MFFICLLFIPLGIYLIKSNSKYSQNVTGNIIEVTCQQYTTKDQMRYSCNITFVYTFNEKEYKYIGVIDELFTEYKKNSSISIYLNPSNPEDIKFDNDLYYIGWVMAIIPTNLIFLSIIQLYFVTKYKEIAAIYGTGDIIGDISGSFYR